MSNSDDAAGGGGGGGDCRVVRVGVMLLLLEMLFMVEVVVMRGLVMVVEVEMAVL